MLLPVVKEMRLGSVALATPAIAYLIAAAAGLVSTAGVVAGLVAAAPIYFGGMWLLLGRRVTKVVARAEDAPPDARLASLERQVLTQFLPIALFMTAVVLLLPPTVGIAVGGVLFNLTFAQRLHALERVRGQRLVRDARHRRSWSIGDADYLWR